MNYNDILRRNRRGPQSISNGRKNSRKKKVDGDEAIPITKGYPTSHIIRKKFTFIKTKMKSQQKREHNAYFKSKKK